MIYQALPFEPHHVSFVTQVFTENIAILHGVPISVAEWQQCLCVEPDPYEINFIITADGENVAWLKLNGMHKPEICISMLVVAKEYQHMGIGRFAVRFAENYAREQQKTAIEIQTTKDNLAAISCYQKLGYIIEREMCYAVGDGILRDGYQFRKELAMVK